MGNNKFFLYLITFVSALGGFLFGYDWVVIGGAKIFYETFFDISSSPAMQGWAMSSALIGCLVGAVMSGAWSDKYGRKRLLIIASVLFSLSAYGTGAVDNFTLFIIYRIIGGLGIGIASNISPIYIAEISPSNIRGRLVAVNQLTIVLGILSAQIANWQIGDYFIELGDSLAGVNSAWRWMFWGELIPAGIFLILAIFIPESPRWLAVNGRKDKAVKIFRRIGGDAHAESELAVIDSVAEPEGEKKSDWALLKNKGVTKILILGIVLAMFQQWCGINVIFNYAHEIFSAAGYEVSDVLMNIVITGVTNVIFTFVGMYTVDKLGRRTLLLFGSIGLAVVYLFVGLGYKFGLSGIPMLLLVVLAIACYAMSLAPVTWVVLSEIFPARVRGLAMSIATFALWVASFFLTYSFPILNKYLGSYGTFWIYSLVCFVGFIFLRRRLVETKGKSLEEIEKELIKE